MKSLSTDQLETIRSKVNEIADQIGDLVMILNGILEVEGSKE